MTASPWEIYLIPDPFLLPLSASNAKKLVTGLAQDGLVDKALIANPDKFSLMGPYGGKTKQLSHTSVFTHTQFTSVMF